MTPRCRSPSNCPSRSNSACLTDSRPAGRQPVDEQHAVEVVVFVLDRPGEQPVELVVHLLAVQIVGRDDDLLRPLHRGEDFGKAQAAFLGLDGAAPLDDDRIEEDVLLALGRVAFGIDDEEPIGQIDLIGGQADALLLRTSGRTSRGRSSSIRRRRGAAASTCVAAPDGGI